MPDIKLSLTVQYKDPQGKTHIIESDEADTFEKVPEITKQLHRLFNSKIKDI